MAEPLLVCFAVRYIMATYTASLAMVTAVVATVACDGSGRQVLNPTPLATAGAATHVNIQPSIIRAQPVHQPACPAVPPFVGSLDVHIQAADFPLTLKRVRMTFIDSTRFAAPTVTLPAPIPTVQFGSTLIEARSRRTFPFTFPFGCDTGRTGTLVVFVVISDREGRETTTEVRVPVQ
jgi:hypothetical protein